MYRIDGDGGFSTYLRRIGRYPLLEREDELELARSFHAGDRRAGERLICSHLRDVAKIAAGYRGYGYKVSDLVAEGNVGLVRALSRFEPERGLRFMTYASYWVRAHILEYIVKSWSLVGLGTGPLQSKLFFRLQREKSRLLAEHGAGVEITAMLAERFACSEDRIRGMQQRLESRDLSLDVKVYEDGKTSMVETIVDDRNDLESGFSRVEVGELVRERVESALDDFDERERTIVEQRLLVSEKRTLSDVGESLGLSRERVRQIERRVKTKLRRRLADLATSDPRPALAAHAA